MVYLEANKGNGLARVQKYLNIGNEETVAFGDNINDLEMLANAAERKAGAYA